MSYSSSITDLSSSCVSFIKSSFDKVARQLKSGKDPTDIKVSSRLSDLKPLHASWIVDLYKHMQGEDELILKGFKEAGIYEATRMHKKFLKEWKIRSEHKNSLLKVV